MFDIKKAAHRLIALAAPAVASPAALANWKWCCSEAQHAGGTAQGRCAGNQIVFANEDEHEAQKKKHDGGTGDTSTCSP